MDVRPLVTPVELAWTIAQIVRNRRQVSDPELHKCPDNPDYPDPAGVLDYLAMHSGRHIPRWVLQVESLHAQTLNNRLWWEDRDRQLYWMNTAVRRGQFLSTVGQTVGIASRQGTQSRMDRLEALMRFTRDELRGLTPRRPNALRPRLDEQATRTARRDAASQEADQAWIDAHVDQLRLFALSLEIEAHRYNLVRADADGNEGDDAEEDKAGDQYWIDQLNADADAGRFTPGTMGVLSMAATELRTAPEVLAIDVPRPTLPVHEVLRDIDRLRRQWAERGKTSSAASAKKRNRPVRFRHGE